MGLFDQFVGGAPPSEEELRAVQPPDEPTPTGIPRITVTPERRSSQFDQFIGGERPPEQIAAEKDPWKGYNKPFGELKQTDLSPTEWARWKVLGGASAIGMTPANAQHAADAVMGIGTSLTPMGAVLSAADATYHIPKAFSGERKLANAGMAALDVLGAIPGFNYARRAWRGTPTVIPAHEAPFRETARAAPEIGGFVTPLGSEAQAAGRAGYRAIEQAPIVYHPDTMRNMIDTARNVLPNPRFGPVHTPETAENTFRMLDDFYGRFPGTQAAPSPAAMSALTGVGGRPVAPAARPVHAYDFDELRQRLLSQKGAEAAAGRQAADILDTYMLNPPRGGVLQGEGLLPALRETYGAARGNWRGYKTGTAIEDAADAARIGAAGEASGKNLGNRQRQAFQKYVKTPEGEAKLFGATPAQLDRIEDVVAGDARTNALRNWSNRFGGGAGIGQTGVAGIGASAGAGVGALVGGPWGAAVGAPVGAAVPTIAGEVMRSAANQRTATAGENVAKEIFRSTPLYRQNLAAAEARGMGAMADPRIRARHAITMALMPGVRETGTDWIDQIYTPYQYR